MITFYLCVLIYNWSVNDVNFPKNWFFVTKDKTFYVMNISINLVFEL